MDISIILQRNNILRMYYLQHPATPTRPQHLSSVASHVHLISQPTLLEKSELTNLRGPNKEFFLQ